MAKTKTTLYFDEKLHRKIKVLSAQTGKSMTDLIQEAVEEKYFKKNMNQS